MSDAGSAGRDESSIDLRLFEAGDFARAAGAIADDPVASRVLGFYRVEPERWAGLQSELRSTFWIDAEPLGPVGFLEVEVVEAGLTATFSIFIAEPHRRRGYATRALRALASWAQVRTAVAELVSDTEVDNLPSIRALERAGFERSDGSAGRVTFRLRLRP